MWVYSLYGYSSQDANTNKSRFSEDGWDWDAINRGGEAYIVA